MSERDVHIDAFITAVEAQNWDAAISVAFELHNLLPEHPGPCEMAGKALRCKHGGEQTLESLAWEVMAVALGLRMAVSAQGEEAKNER